LALVAVVTAVLNLDTAVVFLTPVLVLAARQRRLDERPFLYGSVFMANAASLLLPGSNLTNLLVLRSDPQNGLSFTARMLPAWLIACAVTAAFVAVTFRLVDHRPALDKGLAPPPLRLGVGAAATVAAAVLVVTLSNAALPMLALGLIASRLRRVKPRLDVRALALLFALAVAFGTLARLWHGPSRLLDSPNPRHGRSRGLAALLVNNLPAAVPPSAQPAAHPPHPARTQPFPQPAVTAPSPPPSGCKPPELPTPGRRSPPTPRSPILVPSLGGSSRSL
jgi:arsenical pump membrane protein